LATFRIGAAIVIGLATLWGAATAAGTEFNPVRRPVSIGPEANRIIVGFAVTAANAAEFEIAARVKSRARSLTEARTHGADVAALALRTRLAVARSRQLTPDMHVLFLPHTLYGAAIVDALERLRRDPAVKFADIDQRRFPLNVPDDPLFEPTAGASGQWYMEMPNAAITVDGVQTMDLSATNAVSAWNITTGSSGIVIADIDTGVRFDHPDLLRGGLGGRLLPGYDFVGEDYNATTGAALGTYLRANDGDGWDPDPSDPGDWVSSTDQLNAVFPESDCPVANSSWHGTRVVGIFGAITNNGVGIAGMSWGALLLPVRALGKCGGYDSDIITGIEWAAGMPVNGTDEPTVPVNPFPADIINVSLGGSGACASDYQNALATVTGLGVLVVASAGNSATDVTTNSSVESPANCSALVPGIIAVAGLRNVGTKVGYSSLGPEVGVSAPAGNCIDAGGACLRSIDTTTNLGATGPAQNSYTNETDNNLGTSFAAPIVSGIAALMRSVNANLGPAQLVARLESSARAFPADSTGLAICPNLDPTTEECACPPSGQCGSGMVDALAAVVAAQRPIAAIALPAAFGGGAVLDASGSAAACGRQIAGYAWSAAGGVSITSGAAAAKVTVQPSSGSGTISLTVTDSEGAVDSATVSVAGGAATSERRRRGMSVAAVGDARPTRGQRSVFTGERRRIAGVDTDDHGAQSQWVRPDGEQFHRNAAGGTQPARLAGAGHELHGGAVDADDGDQHRDPVRRDRARRRELHAHPRGFQRNGRDLRQRDRRRRVHDGACGRERRTRHRIALGQRTERRRRRLALARNLVSRRLMARASAHRPQAAPNRLLQVELLAFCIHGDGLQLVDDLEQGAAVIQSCFRLGARSDLTQCPGAPSDVFKYRTFSVIQRRLR
jgi:serine protease